MLLAAGLAFRHLLRMPRTGLALLLCEPLLELVLLVVSATDLKNGADPDVRHGLAAVYIGFTVGLGHHTIKWVDSWAAHRFAGGPPPAKPPTYGRARAVHEWKTAGRWIVAAVVAIVLLQVAVWYAGDGAARSLRPWQTRMVWVIGINLIIAGAYTVFPKRAPAGHVEQRTPVER